MKAKNRKDAESLLKENGTHRIIRASPPAWARRGIDWTRGLRREARVVRPAACSLGVAQSDHKERKPTNNKKVLWCHGHIVYSYGVGDYSGMDGLFGVRDNALNMQTKTMKAVATWVRSTSFLLEGRDAGGHGSGHRRYNMFLFRVLWVVWHPEIKTITVSEEREGRTSKELPHFIFLPDKVDILPEIRGICSTKARHKNDQDYRHGKDATSKQGTKMHLF